MQACESTLSESKMSLSLKLMRLIQVALKSTDCAALRSENGPR